MPVKNILLVEDHPIMRAGTRQMVLNYIPDAHITEADNFKKAISAAEEKEFDLAIMDIGIPGGNSVKMVETFKRKWPRVRVLMFSSYDESLYALPFVKAGADGYISKDAEENEFKTALETILFRNKVYLSENLKEESFRMFVRTGKGLDDSTGKLSIREREIVQLLLSGKGVSDIASMLDLHISTVSTHRVRIFKKMGVENLMDLSRIWNVIN